MTVSPQLRAILLASVLAAVAAALALYTLSQSRGGSTGDADTLPPVASLASPRTALPKPKATPAKPKPVKNPFVEQARKAGLPPAIARALGAHEVVVVSLYTPRLELDAVTKAEAEAGAAVGHAGFVAVNVRSEGTARVLTKLLGVLDAPGTLVYRRPGELFMRLDGFNDRETVAQAAQNADPTPDKQTGWARDANAICEGIVQKINALQLPANQAQLTTFFTQLLAVEADGLAELHALKPAPGTGPKVTAMLASYDRMHRTEAKVVADMGKSERAASNALQTKANAAGAQGDKLAGELGAASCALGG